MFESGRWTHPQAAELDILPGVTGPFVERGDGSLMIVGSEGARISADHGKTWSEPRLLYAGPGPGIPTSGPLLRTRAGAIVLLYVDGSTFFWDWDDNSGQPAANVRGDVWSIRSLDDGETWIDRQLLMEGYCGALITIIQTGTGEIVAPVQRLLYDPGRHATSTYVSTDDGVTWSNSNTIDLGGHGHHDGALEATLTELKDGRLLMLMRTGLDWFWEAYSSDKGRSWLQFGPSQIDASTAPGYMARLASSRLALVWNRLYPGGTNIFTRRAGQNTQALSSTHRDELSIAFSEDDAESWSEPVVLARNPRRGSSGGISYPRIFEFRPGELWITTGFQGNLRVSLQESDFVY